MNFKGGQVTGRVGKIARAPEWCHPEKLTGGNATGTSRSGRQGPGAGWRWGGKWSANGLVMVSLWKAKENQRAGCQIKSKSPLEKGWLGSCVVKGWESGRGGGRGIGKKEESSHWLYFWSKMRCLSLPCRRRPRHDMSDFTPCKGAFKKKPGRFWNMRPWCGWLYIFGCFFFFPPEAITLSA